MFMKVLAVFALVGACMSEEHAYSSQSIILHQGHGHEGNHEYKHEQPAKVEYKHEQPAKVEVVKHIITKITPVITKVVPVVHYVQESQGNTQSVGQNVHYVQKAGPGQQSEGHEAHYTEAAGHVEHKSHKGHKPGFSSFHIERHDIPAPAPKDLHKYDGPAKYEFEYKVHDPHTGDYKHQHESRDGHKVEGVYSLHEHDDSIRTVKYHADKKTGFQAEVKHTTKHVEEAKHH